MVNEVPAVSVAIPQYGSTDFTLRAVAAVRRSTYAGDIEVIVFDDASPGGPGDLALEPPERLVVAERNGGFGRAVNAAAAEARGDLLVILNNDTVLAPDCIERLVSTMLAYEPRPGLVSPQYRTFDGVVLEAGSFLDAEGSGWQAFRGREMPRSFTSGAYVARYASAAAVLVDRREFLDSGGFDDAYAPAYYEDTDLCMRLASQGRPVVIDPAAIAYHYEGGTSGTDITTGFKRHQVINRDTFVDRWKQELAGFPPLSEKSVHTQILSGGGAVEPILWAAPHLPRPDREAGHQRMLRMIEAMVAEGVPVAFWAEHAFEHERYGPPLVDRGVRWFGDARQRIHDEASESPGTLQEVLAFADWSAVIVSFPELAERMIPVIRSLRPELPVLVDVVDLHFLREARAAEVGAVPLMSPGREWELGVYQLADGVIGSSSLETRILRDELPGVPSHTFAVAVEEPAFLDGDQATEAVFLGNFDHHPNLDAVDWWERDLHPATEAGGYGVRLTVVGAGSERFTERWDATAVMVRGWVAHLEDVFRTTRVFVVPLRYGAGTKGKIMAAVRHGVPVVTTSVGAESMPEELSPALHVADGPRQFAELVVRFMTDDAYAAQRREATAAAAEEAFRTQRAVAAEFVSWVQRRVETGR